MTGATSKFFSLGSRETGVALSSLQILSTTKESYSAITKFLCSSATKGAGTILMGEFRCVPSIKLKVNPA